MDVIKYGYLQPVNVRDGVPCCPCHDEPMTQTGPDEWRCELGVAFEKRLRELLADEPMDVRQPPLPEGVG